MPAAATNPDPVDFDGYIPLEPTLSWDPGIDGGIPTGYKLYLSAQSYSENLIYDGTDPFYTTDTLLNDMKYFWKVVPYNSVGDAEDCPVWSFTTVRVGAVQIGRGTEEYLGLPIQASVNYNYSQTIYLQSEIEIPESRISKIYYQWNGYPMEDVAKDWVVYMSHTTDTAFHSSEDWVPVEQMTLVFDGEVDYSDTSNWVEIILDTPFDYNNIDNLVIAVDENTDGAAPPESGYFYGTAFPTWRGIIRSDNETNPDPAMPGFSDALVEGIANIRLQLEGMPGGPLFRIYPTSKNFGTVLLETESDPQVFTIKNNGIDTLTILSVARTGTDPAQFQLTDTNDYPVKLAANQATTVNVTFNPTTEGALTDTLEITDDISSVPHLVPLSGIGLDATIRVFPFTETFEDDSFTRMMWTQIQETSNGDWTYDYGAGSGNIYYPHDGYLNARFTGTDLLKITKLVSPIFDLTDVTDPQVAFWYGQELWSFNQNELKIYYRTALDQPWIEIFYDDEDRNEWTTDTLVLPYPSATYQLAFEGIDNYGHANVLDDVTVGPPPGLITTWYGDISSDWTDPDNWSDGVPGPSHTAIIENGTFDPVIETAVTIYKIIIKPGADINISPIGSLMVTGN